MRNPFRSDRQPDLARMWKQGAYSWNPATETQEQGRERCAREHVATIARFRELEALDLVRLLAEPDGDYQWNENDPEESDKFGHDGAWGSIGEWRTDADAEWEQADSCWGHVGYRDVLDPFENCYVIGHMASAIKAYENHAERLAFAGNPAGAD